MGFASCGAFLFSNATARKLWNTGPIGAFIGTRRKGLKFPRSVARGSGRADGIFEERCRPPFRLLVPRIRCDAGHLTRRSIIEIVKPIEIGDGGKIMRTHYKIFVGALFVVFACASAFAQGGQRETYTGTIISFGTGMSTRTTTATFTLDLRGRTTDEQAARFLAVLAEGGQDTLLKELADEDLGSFSVGGRLGRTINAVRVKEVDGKIRVFAVFERWIQGAEVRGGYRSIDYPFGIIEMFIDPKTGKGEGTFIAAAKVRWKRDSKDGEYHVEIENFATFPARLMGVTKRK